jgi:hypothetical protein
VPLSHSGNFLKVINELHVQVPDAPPDHLFVLRKTAATSAAVNSRLKPFTTSSSTTFNAQTCSNAVLKSLTTSSYSKFLLLAQLSGQKNTISDGLDSRNYRRAVSRN